MDKTQFISFLQHYAGSSVQEAEEVVSLRSEYPYSQLLYALCARISKDHGYENHQAELQQAAIHAADRSLLKEIITGRPFHTEVNFKPVSKGEEIQTVPIVTETGKNTIQSIGSSEDVADELMRDLEKLNTVKNNFEMLFVEYSEVKARPAKSVKVSGETAVQEDSAKKNAVAPKDKTKSKKERIIELARTMNNSVDASGKENPKDEKKNHTTGKKGNPGDALIEEIRITKQEIVPETEKQREQMAIINQFIRTQPSISNSKDRQIPPPSDLNPIKSGEFSDNVVSETLVEILIKQGKKDKAIEVLKKLIWKYPQKKSYFAGQIEDLKK